MGGWFLEGSVLTQRVQMGWVVGGNEVFFVFPSVGGGTDGVGFLYAHGEAMRKGTDRVITPVVASCDSDKGEAGA